MCTPIILKNVTYGTCRHITTQVFKSDGARMNGDKGRQRVVIEYANLPNVLLIRPGLNIIVEKTSTNTKES